MEFKQTEVMYFVHHFPTHTTVWEIHETDGYESLNSALTVYGGAFKGNDGQIYMSYEPIMMRRERAENYCQVKNNEFQRFTVIEIQ